MEENFKIVEYDKYCENCEHLLKEEGVEPCDKCLSIPVRNNSKRPEYFNRIEA